MPPKNQPKAPAPKAPKAPAAAVAPVSKNVYTSLPEDPKRVPTTNIQPGLGAFKGPIQEGKYRFSNAAVSGTGKSVVLEVVNAAGEVVGKTTLESAAYAARNLGQTFDLTLEYKMSRPQDGLLVIG